MSKCIEKRRDDLLGKDFINNSGDRCFVIDYLGAYKVKVIFYETNSIDVFPFDSLKRGLFSDKYKPSVFGKGYLGNSKVDKQSHSRWVEMLRRCYSETYRSKTDAYVGCIVCNDWLNYSEFKKWFHSNKNSLMRDENGSFWHLDKDVLVRGNKVYSPDTCCFIPQEVNKVAVKPKRKLTHQGLPEGVGVIKPKTKGSKVGYTARAHSGTTDKDRYLGYYDTPERAFKVYKYAKEAHIKSLAEKWKGKIDDKVYQALLEWKIEITD